MPAPGSSSPSGRPAPGALATAEVLALDVDPTQPRLVTVRPENGAATVPAYLAAGVTLTLGPGSRVVLERIGRRLVIRSAL